MQKRFALIISAVLTLVGPIAYADDQSALMLTDAQIAQIKSNCVSVQSTLTRIHSNDALSRVHLGQEYETISNKFMAPMNSRVALTRLDSVPLARTTSDFNTMLDDFRSAYQDYDQTMLKAIQMKCTDQPVAYYDTITLAQSHRAIVRSKVIALANLIKQYRDEVNTLKAKVIGVANANGSAQ